MAFLKSIHTNRLFDKSLRLYLILAVIISLVEFLIIKFSYPFPDFNSESYQYIYLATTHLNANILPVGYSFFLSAFHHFTNSDYALISFQYFVYLITAIYLFTTATEILKPGKYTRLILFILLFINPLPQFLCNYVTNDSFSLSLTLLWFGQLLKYINTPRVWQLVMHTIVVSIYLAITNSYCLPIISLLAILISTSKPLFKFIGIAAFAGFIFMFLMLSGISSKKLNGWQIANNALYIRPHVTVDSTLLSTPELQELDHLARSFNKRLNKASYALLTKTQPNCFISFPQSPLNKYFSLHFTTGSIQQTLLAKSQAAITFHEYGSYFVKHYPVAYARYFLLPNTANYLLPFLEDLGQYNLGKTQVPPVVQDWFDYQTGDIQSSFSTLKMIIIKPLPYLFLLANIFFLGSLIWWILSKAYRKITPTLKTSLVIAIVYFLLNYCYSISASIVVFKSQMFSFIICSSFSFLLIETIEAKKKQSTGEKTVNSGVNNTNRLISAINI